MADAPSSWFSPKTVMQLGLGTVISLVFVWQLATNIPQTKAVADDIKGYLTNPDGGVIQKLNTIMQQHQDLAPQMREGNRIQCAQCWNSADTPDEVKRCSCSPDR